MHACISENDKLKLMLYFVYFKPVNSFSPCNFFEEKKMTETIKSNIKKLNKKNF